MPELWVHVLIIKIVRDLIYTCSAGERVFCMDVNILGAPNPAGALTSRYITLENTSRGCVLMKNFISDESRKNILPPLPTRLRRAVMLSAIKL